MMDPYPCAAEAPLAARGHGQPPKVVQRESGGAGREEEISSGGGAEVG
jgi:hypothetical protein